MSQINIAYVTVQQSEEGFTGMEDISYAAIQRQGFKPLSCNNVLFSPLKPEMTQFFDRTEMDLFFETLFDYTPIVVFNKNYTDNILKKYWYGNMSEDFDVFDIQDMTSGLAKVSTSLHMVGSGVKEPRRVSTGMTYIHFWNDGDMINIRKCMEQDITIMRQFVSKIMLGVHKLTMQHYYNDKFYTVDLKGWARKLWGMRRGTFNDRCKSLVKALDSLADEINDGLTLKHYFNSQYEYLMKTGQVYSYIDKDNQTIVCHPNVRR